MKGLKMTAKRILTGVLTAAMVVTSVNLPGMTTSVQAAEVYNDTTTALSSLAGSTGLKIYRLTSDDVGKELTSGIYYVDEDLTFTGADSTSSSEAGGNGLKIADGATVYIYIADGKTLTATGGNGYAGTDGENGTAGSMNIVNGTVKGITYTRAQYSATGAGGAGGSGATGGGAAIYVPNSSKIAILGKGSLNATGGTGGAAGNGQNGQKTLYYNLSWYAPYNSGVTISATTNNIGLEKNFSGKNNTEKAQYYNGNIVIGGAGGSGGGGAAGGGAGIGTNGANGNVGANGVAGKYDSNKNDYVDKVAGNSATAKIAANSSGQIYIGNVAVNATGGLGGQAGIQQEVVAKHQHSITYYLSSSASSGNFWVQDGQSGGGGGAGGIGASIGTGGQGGQGGAGGDAGSCWTKDPYSNKSGYAPESVRGANGAGGSNGTGSSSALSDSQYPYNTITFKNLTSANQNYYITKSGTFTAPDYSVSENQTFVGWKVTNPAVALPEAFGETADTSLTTADKIIPAGTEVSTAGIYGNITLEPFVINHTHSWTYETDSTDNSKVYAWCTEDENSEYCPYHGEEKKLTLSLKAEGKTYDGNVYDTSSYVTVDDAITAVTKATAGSVTYYEADRDGNKTGSAIAAPVNAGKYVAEVTVSDGSKSVSATKAFEIKRADQTAIVSMSGYEYGTTVSTPDITGAKENPDVTYYYSTEDKNTDGTEWKDIKNDTLEPGTYYMYAVLAQTGNYKTYTTAPVSFTVQGSDMSGVTAENVTKTYDGNSYGITVNTGSIPNAVVTYGTEAGTYDLKDCPAYKNVGTYTIYYKVEARGYNSFTGSATVTITKKAVTATVTADNKIYDGTTDAVVSAAISNDDLISGDSITIKGLTGTFEDQNAGADKKVTVDSYNAEYAGTGVENYDITIGTEAKASIVPKSIKDAVIKLTPGDVLHTGAEVTQAVDSVTLDGVTLAVSDYEIADSSKMKATEFGVYPITVNGIGNYKDSASVKWKIKDENPPTGEITIAENKWNSFLNSITFGHFFKETQTVTIKAGDEGSGIDKVYYYNSNEALSKDVVEAFADDKWTEIANGGSYNVDPEDDYVVYVKITDKSGNVTYISSEGFVVDKTAPKITGVENNGTYCEDITFTATDANLDTVTVDGNKVALNADGGYTIKADNKNHTITATDKAGNSTTIQAALYNGHKYGEPVFKWSADYSSAEAVFTCENNASHTERAQGTVKKEVTKQATGTKKGEITYTATVTIDGKIYQDTKIQETVIAGSEEIGSNGGKITTEIIVSDDMPKTEIKNLTVETAKSLLTVEELAQVEAGAEVTIYLEANSLEESEVSTDDKKNVESQLESIADRLVQSEGLTSKKEVATGVQYIDLSLYKRVGDGAAKKLRSTGENELEITVDIPDNLKSDNGKRTYYVVRVHETEAGTEVDILPTTKSGDTLTFKTDRFSTYAIVYAEPNGIVVPTKVTLDKTQATLTSKGSTLKLTATVGPDNATNKKVTWKSSDTNVATVDENGLVTAVGNGTATITVTTEEGGLTATVKVTVNIYSGGISGGNSGSSPSIPVQKPTSVKIDKTSETLTSKGSTTKLTATVEPDSAANKKVTWKSSDTNVATVDENGLVTAVGNGTATITATTEEGGFTASATVTVNISSGDNGGTTPEPTKTPEIKPTEAPVTPTAEPTKEPEATVEPTTEPTVKPTEKPSVEDQSGLSGSEVSKLKLPILLAKGKGGDKKILISWASYKGADGYDCYWSYCNGKQNFKKFTGVKASKYRATHKNLKNNREYKYFVAAYKMVDGKKVYIAKSNQLHVAMKNAKKTNAKKVTVNKASVTLKAGKTFVIKSSTKLENAKKKQLLHADAYRYYTSDKNVAYVSKNGKVKAVKKGKCVIYILANNGVYRKIKIVVK